MARNEVLCVDFSVFEIADPDPECDPLAVVLRHEREAEQGDEAMLVEFGNALIAGMVSRLPELERQIIRWLYGFDAPKLSAAEIGERLNLTRTAVWKIEQRALARLRHLDAADVLREAA